ncbi:MAG: peptide chain release factor N(5)-glutamine methyltransferase [Haliscomenobacter sp.]|nr:peptide chain release factor N(5)-glutamine methyltransferase [Haliscomenobacter sp.]MBK7474785.1 peptide chain release factor N(5)-glutamine methyltransferase [Haliscomenobacter sp.]MBK8877566.1 peptide chain release factor N(5)-glutamine methyltransferase [Haliscomenobacter sp.]
MMQIRAAFDLLVRDLAIAYQDRGEARSVARIAFEDLLGVREPFPNAAFSSRQQAVFEDLQRRLLQGEPVQYVTGQAYFYGEKFEVSPAVLIPRPETEELTEWAIQILNRGASASERPQVLDIGAGSGCISIILKKKFSQAEVWAMDISPSALEVAKRNAAVHQAGIRFHLADLLDSSDWRELPEADLFVSNPPYIPESERQNLARRVLDFEPGLALFVPEEDPLRFYRAMGELAQVRLKHGGSLLAECHYLFAGVVEALWKSQGFGFTELRKDLSGHQRMVRASRVPFLP